MTTAMQTPATMPPSVAPAAEPTVCASATCGPEPVVLLVVTAVGHPMSRKELI